MQIITVIQQKEIHKQLYI